MTASALPVSLTSVALAEIAAQRRRFRPPVEVRAESLEVACALAGACYALPDYARELNASGRPRWWPFGAAYQGGRNRRSELTLAVGFLLTSYEKQCPPGSGDDVLEVVRVLREELEGPYPGDPARVSTLSAVDALGFAASCYAVPAFVRRTGTDGPPLLWPWPTRLWKSLPRPAELLMACAMLVAEMERHAAAVVQPRPALTVVSGGVQ